MSRDPAFLHLRVLCASAVKAKLPCPVVDLAHRLDELIAPVAEHADVGVCVRSLDRGDELYARNADAAFVPASNQKLLVTAAALDALGPGFRFTTRVLSLGPRRSGTVHGDLVLQGGGDPTVVTAGLAALAERVETAGIRHVAGRVRGDDSIFDRRRRGIDWAWDDEPFPYAAPISGLTLNQNTVGVEVRPGARPGLPPVIHLDPAGAPTVIRIRALTAPAGAPAALRVDRTRARDEVVISGQIPCGGPLVVTRVTVEDPPLYAAAVFTALLRARGIRVDGAAVALGTPGSAAPLAEIRSAPLAAILREMNKQSENLVAEMLLKALGMRASGSTAGVGIGGAGEAVLRAFLARAGLRGPSLVLADGSGLSREDLISPRNMVRLLAAMDRHPERDAFFASLPVAGVDGTLRRRMIGTAAAGAVRAKTGTLAHVTALSGVATTQDGERLAFSILTNNYPGRLSEPGGPRAMEDAVAVVLAGFRRSGVQAFGHSRVQALSAGCWVQVFGSGPCSDRSVPSVSSGRPGARSPEGLNA